MFSGGKTAWLFIFFKKLAGVFAIPGQRMQHKSFNDVWVYVGTGSSTGKTTHAFQGLHL